MWGYFQQLADFLDTQLVADEQYTAWLAGEVSDFVRFNRALVRQAGQVRQFYLALRLIQGQKQVSVSLTMTGLAEDDQIRVQAELVRLRRTLGEVADDPHLLLSSTVNFSERIRPGTLPAAEEIVARVVGIANGYDFVGFLAYGPTFHGFANSLGQRNWHEAASFSLDWSLYAGGDKAVKAGYADADWQDEEFRARFDHSAAQLLLLQKPARTVPAQAYRAYLAPAAVAELVGLLNWGGFSEKALQTKRSALLKLAQGEARLHPHLSLAEAGGLGLAPGFQADGFIKPAQVELVRAGAYAGSLISPRTAKEYGLTTNGANTGESAESLQMAPGALDRDDVLTALDTGVYIGNLWYLNYSDRMAARITGMTRFASFWVEDGRIVAPLNVMRFDDSLYRLLGENLLDLTRQRELIVDTQTYGARQTASALVPGALVRGMTFVL